MERREGLHGVGNDLDRERVDIVNVDKGKLVLRIVSTMWQHPQQLENNGMQQKN